MRRRAIFWSFRAVLLRGSRIVCRCIYTVKPQGSGIMDADTARATTRATSRGAISRADCEALDAADPLGETGARFAPGAPGTLYFDANSVGAMPRTAPGRLEHLIGEWQNLRRRGWSESDWLAGPQRLGAKLAPVLGASPDEVVVCDTTSINLFKALAAAVQLRPGRRRIVSEAATFPTDLYVPQGLARPRYGPQLPLLQHAHAIPP